MYSVWKMDHNLQFQWEEAGVGMARACWSHALEAEHITSVLIPVLSTPEWLLKREMIGSTCITPDSGHFEILRPLNPKSGKLISVCTNHVSANLNIPFPYIFLIWASWVVCSEEIISRSKVVLGKSAGGQKPCPKSTYSSCFPHSLPQFFSKKPRNHKPMSASIYRKMTLNYVLRLSKSRLTEWYRFLLNL